VFIFVASCNHNRSPDSKQKLIYIWSFGGIEPAGTTEES